MYMSTLDGADETTGTQKKAYCSDLNCRGQCDWEDMENCDIVTKQNPKKNPEVILFIIE